MERAIKNWWLWVILGILYIVLSGFFFFNPAASFSILAEFMVIFFFVAGIFEIFYSITNRHMPGWGFNLAMGILQVFIGAYLLKNPGLPDVMLLFLVMFWLIFYSISAISFSFSLKKIGVSAWWISLVIGILGLIVGLAIPYSPASGVYFITMLIGGFALIYGIYSLYFGFAIRRFRN